MDKGNKNFNIVSFLFNNESFINGLLENLKKELMEVIFSDNLSLKNHLLLLILQNPTILKISLCHLFLLS